MGKIIKNLSTVIKLLNASKIVAIPTETVYGLAANALDEQAVLQIFKLKNRPLNNPLIIHTHSIDEVKKYVTHIPPLILKLMKKFSPGPITYLLPKNNIPDLVTANSKLVGIRIPNHPLLLQLLQKIDFPLAAPSANIFSYISPTNAKDVLYTMDHKIDFILDGGESDTGLESTIVECKNNKIIIHRLGVINAEQIKQYLKCSVIIKNKSRSKSKNILPGQHLIHYSPHTPLFEGDIKQMILENKNKKIGILSFRNNYKKNFKGYHIQEIVLSKQGKLEEASQKFYKSLIILDNADLDIILTSKFPNQGLGIVLNDRLKRAALKFN